MVLPGEIFGASLRRPKLRPAKYAPVSAANTRNSTNSNLSGPFGNACRVAIEISVLAIINWPASAITGVAILPASGLRGEARKLSGISNPASAIGARAQPRAGPWHGQNGRAPGGGRV